MGNNGTKGINFGNGNDDLKYNKKLHCSWAKGVKNSKGRIEFHPYTMLETKYNKNGN